MRYTVGGSLPHNGGIAGVAHTPAARTGGDRGGGRACSPSPHLEIAMHGATEEGGRAGLPDELMSKVLEMMLPAGQDGGWGFTQSLATVRLVCSQWQAMHDALVTRLVLREETTDEAMGMLVKRFPAVVSIEMSCCKEVTNEGLRAVSNMRKLSSLNVSWCTVSDEAMRAVSSLPGSRLSQHQRLLQAH
jgi:hypothetical protein